MVVLPAGWETANAPVANTLSGWGAPLGWWLLALLLLAVGLALASHRPRWSLVLAAGAALALGIAANGLVDDAYIQFRYAANLAAGNGMVFNAGERIEGASGGVWIGALALGPLLGADPGVSGRLLSLALTVAATLAAGVAIGRVAGPRAGAAAALLWASVPTTAMYAASGLETSAYALVLWLAVLAAVGPPLRLPWLAGVGLAVVRPDGVVLGAAATPWIGRLGRPARSVLLGTLAGAAAMALARVAYFGAPLPRPVTVKGFSAAAGPGMGLSYLGHAVLEWWPLLLALPMLAVRWRTLLPAVTPVAVWTLLVVARGGDWMPGSRYLLPLLVLLVGAAAALSRLSRWTRLAAPLLAVWACLLLAPIPNPGVPVAGKAWRAMAELRTQSRWWEALGAALRRTVPPGTTLATGAAGALPYSSGLPTLDMTGLCSVVTAHHDGRPGHRLWGIRQAIGRCDVIYTLGLFKPLPQVLDPRAVLAAAEEQAAAVPGIRPGYQPVLVMHRPETNLDVVADVLWVRASLVSRLSDLAGSSAPVPRP
jgi:arabinofuranosyltransferase